MKKRLLTSMLLTMCLTAAPAAVFAGEADTAQEESADQDAAQTEDSAEEKDAAALSDDLYAFQVKIGEDVYQFPMTYEEFTAKGWTIGKNDDPEMSVGSNSYGSVTFNRGNDSVYVDMINLGINSVSLKECLVAGITVDSSNGSFEDGVELPKGIVLGKANMDDIKAAYGDPSDVYEGDLYTQLTYSKDMYEEARLYVYKEGNALQKIDLRNFVEPEGFDKGEVSTETPDIVTAYQAPTELGDDIMDPVVEFCGDLYSLPAPVTAFTANGWTLNDVSDDDYVEGRGLGFVDMSKNNQTVHVSVYNKTDNAVTVENCFIQELEVGSYDNEAITLKLSGGFTLGSSKADIQAAAKEKNYLCEEDGDYINVSATKDTTINHRAQFYFNKDEDPEKAASVTYRNEDLPE